MNFQEIFQNFMFTLLTGVLGVLATFLIGLAKLGFDWLRAKITSVENQTAQDLLKNALSIVETAVYNTVTSLQQTVADDIKESLANKDGHYTREDLLNLKEQALSIILDQMDSSVTEILEQTYGDLTVFVGNMIETQVYNMKQNSKPKIDLIEEPKEETVTESVETVEDILDHPEASYVEE